MYFTRILLSIVFVLFASTALAGKPEKPEKPDKTLICHVGNEVGPGGEDYLDDPGCVPIDDNGYFCPDAGKIDLIEVAKAHKHLNNPSHGYDGISDYLPGDVGASGEGNEDGSGDGIDDGCETAEELLTCPCWDGFTETELVAAPNARPVTTPRCEVSPTFVFANDTEDSDPQIAAYIEWENGNECILDLGSGRVNLKNLQDDLGIACYLEAAAAISQSTLCSRIVFVTSDTFTGDLVTEAETLGLSDFTDDGLGAGDAICTKLGGDAGLLGTFTAWLSDSTTPAQNRVSHSIVPYVLTNGLQVAADYQDLTFEDTTTCTDTGSFDCLDNMIDRNESQGFVNTQQVWTSTQRDGTTNGSDFCDDWTSADSGYSAAVGITNAINKNWTQQTGSLCNSPKRLYCFQD
jgi:hypothetical protein